MLRPGQLFVLYVGGYGVGRLWVEALRIDTASASPASAANIWVSGVTILGAVLWFLWWQRRPAHADQRAERDPEQEPATIEEDAVASTVAPVASIGPDATVAEAAAEMHRRSASALVVLEDDRLIGLLTERDLVRVIVDGADPAEVRVRQRMRMDVVTVAPGTDAMEARELMGRHALRHLPVVDGGRVVGLIEQTEPRTGLNFGERRAVPERGTLPEPVADFRGPYADGPPASELEVDAADLSTMGFAEIRRGIVICWTLASCVLLAAAAAAVGGDPPPGLPELVGHRLGRRGRCVREARTRVREARPARWRRRPACSPSPSPTPASACLDEVPPFDSATSGASSPRTSAARRSRCSACSTTSRCRPRRSARCTAACCPTAARRSSRCSGRRSASG